MAACTSANLDEEPADAGESFDGNSSPDGNTGMTPYRHTITIDGIDDFSDGERFATTSQSFQASITWDATSIFLGYSGPDIESTTPDAATKWLHVYLDTQTGGTTAGETYNTQTPSFPTGFEADFYFRWKADGTLTDLKHWDGDSWEVLKTTTAERMGSFVETAVLLSDIGSPSNLSVLSFMLNEKDMAEACFAGLYADSFTDDYHMTLSPGHYLAADMASFRSPNDALNKR